MKVRHAEFFDVYGRPAKFRGMTIVPASVRLHGNSFGYSFPLAEHTGDFVHPIARRPIEQAFDAAWVFARMQHAFGFTPEPSENEKTLLQEGFVAVADGEDEGIAFECKDHYGRTALMFSNAETDEPAKAAVARAFWGWLLSEPEALEDFKAEVEHMGGPFTLHFGCEDGEPYCREEPD